MNLEVSNILTIYYLQLLYREVKGILLYQGFPRPILPTKHPESGKGCFADKIGPKKSGCTKFYRLFTISESLQTKMCSHAKIKQFYF